MIKRTICIENACFLKFANEQMVVSYSHVKGMEDVPDKTVPIEDLGMLVLEHQQISLTHYLLNKLVAGNVAVVTCNDSHHPTGLLMPLEANTLQSERFRVQIEATEPLKKQLWQQTVKAKITNQAAVLKKWEGKYKLLENLADSVKSGDADNNEAIAAAHYWQNIFPPAWNFYRKRDGSPPNNLLNYGYAIVRAGMARAIVGAGLLPTLGIFHRNRYNAYCLADDMMEPYRPFVCYLAMEQSWGCQKSPTPIAGTAKTPRRGTPKAFCASRRNRNCTTRLPTRRKIAAGRERQTWGRESGSSSGIYDI